MKNSAVIDWFKKQEFITRKYIWSGEEYTVHHKPLPDSWVKPIDIKTLIHTSSADPLGAKLTYNDKLVRAYNAPTWSEWCMDKADINTK